MADEEIKIVIPPTDGKKPRGRPKGSTKKPKAPTFIVDDEGETKPKSVVTLDQNQIRDAAEGRHKFESDPEADKIRERLFRLYVSDPKSVEKAIDVVGTGTDAMAQLDGFTTEQLVLVEKASRIESSKKLDEPLIKSACQQLGTNVDSVFGFNGKFEKRITQSKAVPVLAKDAMADSPLMMIPSWAQLGIVVGSHFLDTYLEKRREISAHPQPVVVESEAEPIVGEANAGGGEAE